MYLNSCTCHLTSGGRTFVVVECGGKEHGTCHSASACFSGPTFWWRNETDPEQRLNAATAPERMWVPFRPCDHTVAEAT